MAGGLRYREPAISLEAVVKFVANLDKRESVAAKLLPRLPLDLPNAWLRERRGMKPLAHDPRIQPRRPRRLAHPAATAGRQCAEPEPHAPTTPRFPTVSPCFPWNHPPTDEEIDEPASKVQCLKKVGNRVHPMILNR